MSAGCFTIGDRAKRVCEDVKANPNLDPAVSDRNGLGQAELLLSIEMHNTLADIPEDLYAYTVNKAIEIADGYKGVLEKFGIDPVECGFDRNSDLRLVRAILREMREHRDSLPDCA